MFSKPLPRFVIPKPLASGSTAFYFNVPTLYRSLAARSRMSHSARITPLPAGKTAKVAERQR